MNAQPKKRYTAAEYFEREAASVEKHEYINGEIFPLFRDDELPTADMAGARRRHDTITANLIITLGGQIRSRPCRIHTADMRVKVGDLGNYTYPDVSVVCGKPEFEEQNGDSLLNPTALIEVLSKSTESYDRGRKFEDYRTIVSLQSYVLVSQERPSVEVFTRQASGKWLLSEARGLDQTLHLESIDCNLALSDIYLKVDFPA